MTDYNYNNFSLYFYRLWIGVSIVCVLCMVAIGGYTRLNNAGLSITEWKPMTGIILPITKKAWQLEAEKYKGTPEFQQYNFDITISEFKRIYLIEYIHRLGGRLTGIIFIFPLLYFLLARNSFAISKRSKIRLIIVLALGFLQGFMGWYMVKSGLVDKPHVSPLRLSAHLGLAVIIFSLLWYEFLQSSMLAYNYDINKIHAYNKIAANKSKFNSTNNYDNNDNYYNFMNNSITNSLGNKKVLIYIMGLLLIAVSLQIVIGALVAGLKAGLIYNTFPLMDGKIIPDGLFILEPVWNNFWQNPLTVQFLHRLNGIIIFTMATFTTLWYFLTKDPRSISKLGFWLVVLLLAILVQIIIGIIVLISYVPLWLALLHQMIVFFILGLIIFILNIILW